ncbi:hypothetical protein [Nocardioides litoris]|uniref:hypothetical protein n=1 Tax=Nocardioides litoris TaxID=1926648 RepID=UPI00111E8B1F|nr:hypothetical protein [Nocardioides litoris]
MSDHRHDHDSRDLRDLLDASFGDGPPPPAPADRLVPARRALRRRRRALLGGAAAAVAAAGLGATLLTGPGAPTAADPASGTPSATTTPSPEASTEDTPAAPPTIPLPPDAPPGTALAQCLAALSTLRDLNGVPFEYDADRDQLVLPRDLSLEALRLVQESGVDPDCARAER